VANLKIGVVGLWHLGCVLCAAWSKLGSRVIGFDYDKARVENLDKAIPPLYEPDLSETIKASLDKGNLLFSNRIEDLNRCDFIFLSYDTPVRDDDSSDTTILGKAVDDVRRVMKDHAVLIVSSQSPVEIIRDRNLFNYSSCDQLPYCNVSHVMLHIGREP